MSELKENILERKGLIKMNQEKEEDKEIIDDEKNMDARESSQNSFRYMYQYFCFFIINFFQIVTAIFYVILLF